MSSLSFAAEEAEILQNRFPKIVNELVDESQFEVLKEIEVRDDDVFLIGNMKSGTTWLQELVWLIGNDLNFEGAGVVIDERFPVLEVTLKKLEATAPHLKMFDCHRHPITYIQNMKSPRFIKMHVAPKYLPRQLLSGEKRAKIVYISRNAKDVCLSSYYFSKNLIKLHNCSLEEYCILFMGKYCVHWESILYFWNLRNKENVLFVRYEEMKNNLGEVIQKVAKFFNKTITEEQEKELVEWLQFHNIKANAAVNRVALYGTNEFIRKGKVDGYKTEMSPKLISMFDNWIKESLKDSDYYEYE